MGLEAKHRERDSAIPKLHEDFLHAIKKDLLDDNNILGVFYGGLIGNKNADLYSDIIFGLWKKMWFLKCTD